MTRSKTATKRRSCADKRRHGTWDAAAKHMQTLVDGGACADRLTVYGPCKFCAGGFHVGHIGRRAATA